MPNRLGSNTAGQSGNAEPFKVEKTEVAKKDYPKGFPANIPVEEGAEVVYNYNATNSQDNKTEGTRVYVSKLSLEENLRIYSNYFKGNGWVIIQTVDDKDTKLLVATKTGQQLNVVISQNTVTGKIKVTITVIELTPSDN